MRYKTKALSLIILAPAIWGTTFAVVKQSLTTASPLAFTTIRFAFTCLILVLISRSARASYGLILAPRTKAHRQFRFNMLILGFSITFGYVLQNVGLVTTTTSKSAFLTSTTVIWTPFISHYLGRERLTVPLVISIILALVGIGLMTRPFSAEPIVIGDVYTVGCALCFAIYIAWIDRVLPNAVEIMNGSEVKAGMLITSGQMFTGTAGILVAMVLLERPVFAWTPGSVSSIVYLGVVATAFTAYIQARYQKEVTPAVASVIYMLEPVVALLISLVLLDEPLRTLEAFGALSIIAGVIIAQKDLWMLSSTADPIEP